MMLLKLEVVILRYVVKKISVNDESNEMGTIMIGRLIEKMLLQELNLPVSHESLILFNHNDVEGKDDNNAS